MMGRRSNGTIGKRVGKRGVTWHGVIAPPRHPVTGEKRKRIWVGTFPRRRDAVEALTRVLEKLHVEDRALRRGEIVDPDATVAEWLDSWLRYWQDTARPSDSTVRSAFSECRHIQDALGEHQLSELRWEHVQTYVDQSLRFDIDSKGDPISLNVVRRRLGRLRQILEYAVQKDMIAENPAAGVHVRRDGA